MSLNELREMQSNKRNNKLNSLINKMKSDSQTRNNSNMTSTYNASKFMMSPKTRVMSPLPDEINFEKYKYLGDYK